jgi:hypothetical protein
MKEPIMPFDFVPTRSRRRFLAGRRTLQLDNAEGTVLSVESGCLWITMENDSRDIVLAPGMRFEVDRSGRTIIAAEEDSRFGLLQPAGRQESVAARMSRIARKLGVLFNRWGKRRTFVPHY